MTFDRISVPVPLAVICALISSVSVFAGGSAPPGLRNQVEKLVIESKISQPACEDYSKKVKVLIQGLLNGEPLTDKVAALKLLALSHEYSGMPEASKKVLALVRSEYKEGDKTPREVTELVMAVSDCGIVVYYDMFRTLINSARPLVFSPAQKRELANSLLASSIKDLGPDTTSFNTLIHGALLEMLVTERVIETSDALFVEILDWSERAELGRREVSAYWHKNPNSIRQELMLMGPLSIRLKKIAQRLATAAL